MDNSEYSVLYKISLYCVLFCNGIKQGKQKHLGCKKVVWQRKTATKRNDMRVLPRLTMYLR